MNNKKRCEAGDSTVKLSRIMLIVSVFALGMALWSGIGGRQGAINYDNETGGTTGPDHDLAMYAINLQRPLDSNEKKLLAEKVNWMGTLNGETLLVRVRPEQKPELQKLPYVKKITEYNSKQKLQHPSLSQAQDRQQAPENSSGKIYKNNTKPVAYIVTLTGAVDKPETIRLVENLGGRVLDGAAVGGRYLKVELPCDTVGELAASPLVLYVQKYEQPELLNDRARDIVGARPLAIPSFVTPSRLNGAGVTIGLADSGLDTGSMTNIHTDLQSDPGKKPRVILLKSWAGVKNPADTNGHGTHMAGTLVGSGKASNGKYAGLAPGASLYFQGIVDKNGNTAPPLDLQELFGPAYSADVRVHVDGWGKKQNAYDSSAAQIDEFVRNHQDFLAIFGAGNSGPQADGLTAEANSKNALVVGASISPRPAFESDMGGAGEVAVFSSRGPTVDGRIKPELVAPGTSIISTASRLVAGNLSGRPAYTVMQGTSMASAVTGGAAALLRQYLQKYSGFQNPSAALMKAILINGAQHLDANPAAAGFGQLDIGSTVIALQNKLFELVDDKKGLATGGSKVLEKKITYSGSPFKATLSWTDPAAEPGAGTTLVNNLDLEVISPDGQIYYGNDFDHRGKMDSRNNVEQVYIPNPKPGEYKIVVRGRSILEDTSREEGVTQDFALVFGQPPGRETLAGDNRAALPSETVAAVDDRLLQDGEEIPAGADLYLVERPGTGSLKAYIVGRTWQASGIKEMEGEGKKILVRINQNYREGGYTINPEAKNALLVNGRTMPAEQAVPPGSSVSADINPHDQTIWRASVASLETEGVLAGIDRENNSIKLLEGKQTFSLNREASIDFTDVIMDGDAADLPFGAAANADLDNLLPGMPVQITLGSDGMVYHLAVKRYLTLGQIVGVDRGSGYITLASGSRYHIMAGISITRDQKPAALEALKEGDLAIINLAPGSTEALGVAAFSDVSYGQVIFAEKDTLYLLDSRKGFKYLNLSPETQLYRWGMPAGISILNPGQWVRVALNPATGAVWRVDIAETAERVKSVLKAYIPGQGIQLDNGQTLLLSSFAAITKNGYTVKFRDLLPGEQVTITALYTPDGKQVVAVLAAETRKGVDPPLLKIISTIPYEKFSLVTGKTTATRLYARYPGGDCKELEINASGAFYYPAKAGEAEDVQLVAVDGTTGGVAGLQLNFARRQKGFTDISGHWAETDIRRMVSRGMINGYPDGTFRPDNSVTRGEFAVLLSRLLGPGSPGANLPYRDAASIPDWARNAVTMAYSRGLAVGYEDNTFRPQARITREEAAALLARAYGMLEGLPQNPRKEPDYADWDKVSSWARKSVSMSRSLGLLSGKPGNLFAPGSYITRAETVAALNRLLDSVTSIANEPDQLQ
ncbi:S-layer homology domain-containing protein [Desulfotruncus alcoholivorax]|uniref:S-layer homology domain-containing protein n=1 Tax=Desulfotruncus alcoholivorax TaxID=265477 RepID=UPI0004167F5F|nr:S-layer homology domain-containing protein [Desulfotruncus alcoholivorax]